MKISIINSKSKDSNTNKKLPKVITIEISYSKTLLVGNSQDNSIDSIIQVAESNSSSKIVLDSYNITYYIFNRNWLLN